MGTVQLISNAPIPLAQHLLAQGAPRAAARLALRDEAPIFAAAPASVELVDTAATAARFAASLSALEVGATIAIDVEWRPDNIADVIHRPSLLQLATATSVWLLDLDAPACCTREPLAAVASLLASPDHRVLGFGLQQDIDRLQMVYCARDGGEAALSTPLTATRVVDLRDACLATGKPSCEGGLAVRAERAAKTRRPDQI